MKKAIQFWGTHSDAGKSVVATGFCRILWQDGYQVAPFKAQNMALNSFVTKEQGEIGRAQAVQAEACRIEPTVDINPVLLKPTSEKGSQVIISGKPLRQMSAAEYHHYKPNILKEISNAYDRLQSCYDVIVIEGAGSPAEINLREGDLANLFISKYADASVILIADIDKGGVFASIIGTLELLRPEERARVKGIIINKFRGDITLLKSGIDFIEKRSGIKVLGVLPYFKDIHIDQEDSVVLDKWQEKGHQMDLKKIHVAIIRLPMISNFTDFSGFEQEPDVQVSYVCEGRELDNADIIIIPGSKNTIADMNFLKKLGLTKKIYELLKTNKNLHVIGVCGGYQMLGKTISDPKYIESSKFATKGLNLLPIQTILSSDKSLTRINAIHIDSKEEVQGYEIHHGKSNVLDSVQPLFKVHQKNGEGTYYCEGIISADKRIWGTYLHGIFDAPGFRRMLLNKLCKTKGLATHLPLESYNKDDEYNKLAQLFRENLDIKAFYQILYPNKNDL